MSSVRVFVLPLLAMAAVLLPSRSDGLAHQPAASDNPLNPIGWLVGGKWVAELKGADGASSSVEATFDWMGHQKGIRYAIALKTGDRTATQYEGFYWWHPGTRQVTMLQIDRGGHVTESRVLIEGGKWKQENTVTHTDGSRHEQRVEIVREGPDTFTFTAHVPKDGRWVQAIRITYHRTRPAAASR